MFIFSLNNGTNVCIHNLSIYIKRSEEYTYLIPGHFFILYTSIVFEFQYHFFTFSNSITIKVITKRVIAQIITREEWIGFIALVCVIILCVSLRGSAVSSLMAGMASCSSACHRCPTLSLTHGGYTMCTY